MTDRNAVASGDRGKEIYHGRAEAPWRKLKFTVTQVSNARPRFVPHCGDGGSQALSAGWVPGFHSFRTGQDCPRGAAPFPFTLAKLSNVELKHGTTSSGPSISCVAAPRRSCNERPGYRKGSTTASGRTPGHTPQTGQAAIGRDHSRGGNAGTGGCRCGPRGALPENCLPATARRCGRRPHNAGLHLADALGKTSFPDVHGHRDNAGRRGRDS